MLTALLGFGVASADCAQQRGVIDTRQPNAVRKEFFVGPDLRDARDNPEFYMNNFVVDAPADQSLVPVGTYDNVERIRWEVQEDYLIARKAYEYVTGSDGHGVRGPTETGLIVAVYKIKSHFDVRHAYNPTTGEQLNVIVENTTDRPWYDREWMRVDWSENLVDNPGFGEIFYGSIFGELRFQNVRYTEQDPNSPNAPNFREMEPSEENHHHGGYFDVTSKWLVSPATNQEYGLPTCMIMNFFSGSDTYSCNPQEATIRTSFRRVEDTDFEPLELTRAPYDLVGGPRATRAGWDPHYGSTDQNFHRYAMIHNLWQRSHLSPIVGCASNADNNRDGTADACEMAGVPGSQCDTVMERCTIPYSQRQIKPIVYYVNADMPAQFQDHVETIDGSGDIRYALPDANTPPERIVRGASEEIIATWNLAIMNAIANAREIECRRLGGQREQCHARFFDDDGTTATLAPQEDGAWLGSRPKALNGPAVVLCHNPVRRGDPEACREEGYSVRLGDIRYNHLTYWSGESRAPFGGIAHWGYDPLTGEVISNGAFNMGRSVDFAAAQQRDYIRLILSQMDPPQDNLSLEAFLEGAPSAVLAEHIRNPAAAVSGRMSDEEIQQRMRAVDGQHAVASLGASLPHFDNNVRAGASYAERQRVAAALPAGGTSRTELAFRAAAQSITQNPDPNVRRLETEMIDQHWLANAGVDPRSEITDSLLERVSPLRRMDPEFSSNLHRHLMQSAEARGACFQDVGAAPMIGSVDLQGVARWFLQKYRDLTPEVRARRILQDLRIEAYKGIALHELGHSLGLYHVPVSSYDSMNYNPQYWQLRTRNGTAASTCRPACNPRNPNCPSVRNADRNDDNCMGPRYLDPESDEELGIAESAHPHAGLNYFANTSVMEYQWERFDETVGLGAYDRYAMGILYGRVVETMESDPDRGGMDVFEQHRFAPRLRTQLTEQDRIEWSNPVLGRGVLPIHYTDLAREMEIFDPSRCREATPEQRERYRWRLVDGKICSFAPRDHAALSDMETGLQDESQPWTHAPSWRVRDEAPTGGGALRWGYRVAWDVGTGYPHINYFDQGADIYEVTQSMVRKYDLSYPAQYFRRGQREFLSGGISSAIASRLFRNIRGYHWSVARDVTLYSSIFNQATYDAVAADDGFLRPYLMAGTSIFDFFAGVMLRPEVGEFVASEERSTPELLRARRSIFDAADNGADNPLFNIGVISGRYLGEEFDNHAGGSWDYHHWLRRAGSYEEKPFAAIALTDTRPVFSSISRGLFLDGREFHVNFNTDMPQAFDRLLGGILSEDWATVAMHVDRRGSRAGSELQPMMPRLWADRVQRFGADGRTEITDPNHASLLFPNVGYRQQLPAVIYSMIYSSLNSDLTTVHKLRIFTEGGVEQVDIPEADRVRFTNPESGITYVARRYGPDPGYAPEDFGGRVIDRGIGSRMLEHANALLSAAYQTDGLNADGTPRMVRDASGNLVPRSAQGNVQAQAVRRYRDYVGLVDATRNVSRLLGYGQLR